MLTMYTFKIQHFIITIFYDVVFRYEIIIEENKIYFSTFSEKMKILLPLQCTMNIDIIININ